MKWPAVLMLAAILITAAIQPVAELANILKEKVVLNAALMNSGRAANSNALNIWYMMNLEAYVDEDDYIQLFSDAFSESLDLSHDFDGSSSPGGQVRFTSNSGRFHPITVEFDLLNTTYNGLSDSDLGVTDSHDRPVTLVTVTMETPYLFRTFWLRQANGVLNDSYTLTETRKFLVQVIN